MVFAGRSAECIEAFGIKHTAKELPTKADVPGIPGIKDFVESKDEVVEEARKMGSLPLLFQPGTRWLYGPSVDVQALLVGDDRQLSGIVTRPRLADAAADERDLSAHDVVGTADDLLLVAGKPVGQQKQDAVR